MEKIILTGDRPTGKLHIGHFVGSLRERVRLQNEGDYDKMYVMIADSQALTDNYGNVQKVRDNIIEVALDYLAVGIDPSKVTIFIQSEVRELTEFTFYYMNLVTLSRTKSVFMQDLQVFLLRRQRHLLLRLPLRQMARVLTLPDLWQLWDLE